MMRHVIYSEIAGVYLGNKRWSNIDRTTDSDTAPTYVRGSAEQRIIEEMPETFKCKFVPVSPSKPGFRATSQDCMNATLSGWGKDSMANLAEKVEKTDQFVSNTEPTPEEEPKTGE